MSGSESDPEAVLVLDIGKSNLKVVAVDPAGRVLATRTAANVPRPEGPYPHADVEAMADWLTAALVDLAHDFEVLAVVPTAYGSAAALIDGERLVLPVMDYEAEPPVEVARAYAEVAPPFEECCCPINPAGLTLGRQLFWQERCWPREFARARWILPFAQYWSWRLTGTVAGEVTSLGAQTQLWRPGEGGFSSLVERRGWASKLPPLSPAFAIAGHPTPEVGAATSLPPRAPVLVGIHDSNANYARYLAAGLDDLTLISSGTWLIVFNPALPLDRLRPGHDMVSNTDLFGRPVACARFMGGREYALVAGGDGLRAEAGASDLQALVDGGTFVMPSFTDSGGPCPGTGGRGRVLGAAPETPAARAALATLYVALMTDLCLDLLESRNRIVLDGGLVDNLRFAPLLAALRPAQRVLVSRERDGTAVGAALLWGWSERKDPVRADLEPVAPADLEGLGGYRQAWRTRLTEITTLPWD